RVKSHQPKKKKQLGVSVPSSNTFLELGSSFLDVPAIVSKNFFHKYPLKPGNKILAEDEHRELF
uniref:Uncharacterized protein n=1 Tax=Mus spicilegus TaxID=10103 RepID=A0A8C6HWT2_MUSSI